MQVSDNHRMVRVAIYFEKEMSDDEVMKFVDDLLHCKENVLDYEYDHITIQN